MTRTKMLVKALALAASCTKSLAFSELFSDQDFLNNHLEDAADFEKQMELFNNDFKDAASLLGLDVSDSADSNFQQFTDFADSFNGGDSFDMGSLLDSSSSSGSTDSSSNSNSGNSNNKSSNHDSNFGSLASLRKAPPKNDTSYLSYVSNKLKLKIDPNQAEVVEKLEKAKANHQILTKTDDMKLTLFQAMAERMDDDGILDQEDLNIMQRSSLGMQEQNPAFSNIGYFLDSIWNYGCWCYFGENMRHGRGTPVNEVDKTCRALNYCYQCVRLDERENNENPKTCAPGEVAYNRPVSLNKEAHEMQIACAKENQGDSCKINTCQCETQFISRIISFFFENHRFEPQYKHDKGLFNPNDSCGPLPPNWRNIDGEEDKDHPNDYGNGNAHWNGYGQKNPQGTRQCCGQYPDRKPYNTAIQGCCKGTDAKAIHRIFRTDGTLQCCKDGHIRLVCPDYVDDDDDDDYIK